MIDRRQVLRSALGGVLTVLGRPARARSTREIPASGPARPELAPFDRMMIQFHQETNVPGSSIAVARHGRLVYARGFGLADLEAGEPVRPRSLFRIASVTKPITGTAVLHLVGKGKLRLEDRMVDILKLKPTGDPRIASITIAQLLHHTGGWDRDKSFDPMFRPIEIAREEGVRPPAGPKAILSYMMKRPLDFAPGTHYAYSNFGYCILGLVIEAVSGQGYEEFVRKDLLAPSGIHAMRIGRTLPDQRAPGEVRYYAEGTAEGVVGPTLGKQVPWPYGGWYLEAMAAHGAWIASAADLVRFATQMPKTGKDAMLTPSSLRALFAPPAGRVGHKLDGEPKDRYYACGWDIVSAGAPGRFNAFHTGSLDGTSSILVRRSDGLCWAVLFNSRKRTDGQEPAGLIDGRVHTAADAVRSWPDIDLFRS